MLVELDINRPEYGTPNGPKDTIRSTSQSGMMWDNNVSHNPHNAENPIKVDIGALTEDPKAAREAQSQAPTQDEQTRVRELIRRVMEPSISLEKLAAMESKVNQLGNSVHELDAQKGLWALITARKGQVQAQQAKSRDASRPGPGAAASRQKQSAANPSPSQTPRALNRQPKVPPTPGRKVRSFQTPQTKATPEVMFHIRVKKGKKIRRKKRSNTVQQLPDTHDVYEGGTLFDVLEWKIIKGKKRIQARCTKNGKIYAFTRRCIEDNFETVDHNGVWKLSKMRSDMCK